MTDNNYHLDHIDRGIVELLRKNVKTTNKQIAQKLDVAESTVAARIRSMSERGVMRVLAETDLHAFGYHFVTFIGIHIRDRDLHLVAQDLAQIEEVASLVSTFGRYDLMANVLAKDAAHFNQLLEDHIGKVEGVQRVEISLVTNTAMWRLEYAGLEPQV